jgi:hypothetical protein
VQKRLPRDSAVSQTNTGLVAPTVANDFFAAFCSRDAHYLAAHTAGNLTVDEADLTAYFASLSGHCFSFRYLGSLTPEPGTDQYVYVLAYGEDGERWYVLTIEDGVAVNLE